MALEVGSLTVPVSADLGPLNADLERLKNQLGRAEAQTQGVTRSMKGMESQTRGLTAVLRPLSVALAGVFSFRAVAQMTDAWSTMNWQLQNAVGSAERAAAVMGRLNQVARSTWSPIQTVTESFIRQNAVMTALGYSTEQQLLHTEALNAAILVSGLRGARAESVAAAWTRAMASGALRGQEFNTIAENSSRLMQALADKLGVTVPELRKLASEGKITSDVMFGITESVEDLRKQLEGDATFSGSLVLIGNSLMRMVGELDKAAGASSTLGSALVWVADNIERVVTYVAVATGGWLAYATAVTAVNAGLFTTAGALLAVRRAFMALGIGLLVVGISELIIFINRLVTATGGWGEALELLGDVAAGVWEGIGISAQAIVPALQAVWLEVQAGFTDMIRTLQLLWNGFIETFEAPALTVTIGGQTHELIGGLDLSAWKADVDDASDAALELQRRAAALRDEASTLANEGFDVAAESLQRLLDLADEANESIDLSGDGGVNRNLNQLNAEAQKLADAYRDIIAGGREFIAAQELERRAIGMTDLEANKLRYTFDLLNEAKRAGIAITPQVTEELTNLAHQMAEAEEATNRLREAYDFAKDTFKGFFSDLKRELQNGASIWEAFGTAAANALDRIADKALDLAISGIFDMIFGAFTGGGGNFLSGILGFENGTSYAPGGVAVVGERGPELVHLPGGSQVIPNNRVIAPSQASFGGGGSSGTSRIALDVFVKDDGKIGAIARQEAGAVVETTIREYDTNQLPDSVQRISTHPRMRHAPA